MKRKDMTLPSFVLLVLMSIGIGKADASFMMVEPGVPHLSNGNMAFGDFDNDGDLDIMTIGSHSFQGFGSSQARLYRNEGNWQFVESGYVFGNFVRGGVAWGDFDNDGWLDIVLCGTQSISGTTAATTLFRNEQGQGFTASETSLHPAGNSNLIRADLDNDFDPDLLVIGSNNAAGVNSDLRIYYNLGGGEYQYDALAGLPNYISVSTSYLRTTDYDKDGYLDLSIGAARAYGGIYSPNSIVLRRTADGMYENVFGDQMGGGSGIEWFDLDNDGDLDLLYTGHQTSGAEATILYINDHSLYVNTAHSFPNISFGDLAAADFDNDGDEDLFITGGIVFSAIADLYRNDGNGVFTYLDLGLQPAGESYAFWADLDNDNDLDLAYTGDELDDWTMFYRNDGTIPNLPPTPPLLSYSAETGFAVSGATDSATPVHALSYDLRIGTSPGAADVYHPMADIISGYRRVPGPGRSNLSKLFLPPGSVYYASAQAIDGGFLGSAWGPEIMIDLSVANDDPSQAPQKFSVYPNPFSHALHIRLEPSDQAFAAIEIFNIKGQLIRVLESTDMVWDGKTAHGISAPNGVYFVKLSSSGSSSVRRVLLIR